MAPVIDAHQHFWTADAPFLTPEWGPLRRAFAPSDLAGELAAAEIDGTVSVQSDNTYDDTKAMLRHAVENDFVLGVVGWVPLLDVAEASRAIDVFSQHPQFCGVRHLNHTEPDPDWLARDALVPGLRLLADRQLTFDVVAVQPRHLEHIVALAERLPELRILIDHLAKPPIRDGGWEPWATLLARAAACHNVYAKVSGLNTAAVHDSWSATTLQPYVDHALHEFGPERLMFGSDWPVATLAGDYQTVWQETNKTLIGLSDDERAAVLGGTAVRLYRLKPPADHLTAPTP